MPEAQEPPRPTPGWYPDGSGSQRYWDGSQWTDHQAPTVQSPGQPKKMSMVKKGLLIASSVVVGFIALLVVIGLIIGPQEKDERTSSAATNSTSSSSATAHPALTAAPVPSSTVAAPAPAPTSAAVPVSVACPAAPQILVDQINGQLAVNNPGWLLANTFIVDSPEGVTYVGGNIMEGDKRVSSADVWVARGGIVIWALSGSAREYTPQLADGRDQGWSAGDEYGQAVQDCTIADMRAGN